MKFTMPANTGDFFKYLTSIAAFDILETSAYLTRLLSLPPRDPVDENFEALGIESVYFLNNLGTFIFVLAFKVLLCIVWIVLYPLQACSKPLRKRRKKLGNSIFWNSWITVINESVLLVVLFASIALKYNFEFGKWGQTV